MEQKLLIYNTLTRTKERFTPLHAPNVGMYVCGPTVYGDPHLGHARPAITFDILFRYLKHLGYKVRYVRNITDVGHLEHDADEGDDKNDGICHGPLQWGTRNVQTSINAFIEFPASQSLMQSTGEITILGWIKPLKAPEGYADFFTKGDYTVMKMQGRDDLVFFAGGWGRGTCMVKVPDNWYGRWHMVAGVGTEDTLQLYVDGELVQQQSVKGKIQPTEVPWNIGRNAEMPFSRHSEMQIGSFRIYGAPLNENQIKDIYTNERNMYQ